MKEKKLKRKLICMLLIMGILLPTALSCAKRDSELDTKENGGSTAAESIEGVETGTPDNGNGENHSDVSVTESYLPDTIRSYLNSTLALKSDKFGMVSTGISAHAYQDALTITDCALKSISIPVHTTGPCDQEGKLIFTLYVQEKSLGGLQASALRTYKIKIDPTQYGLTEETSDVMKYIDVDLTPYEIVLAENETLAMYARTDTVVPVMASNLNPLDSREINEAVEPLLKNYPQAQNFYSMVGTSNLKLLQSVLLYDFEFVRTYTEAEVKAMQDAEKQYQSVVDLLKERYEGKYISILGDSISTFEGYSNNTSINSTIGGNLIHYNYTRNPHTWEQTYWGRIIEETGMQLCVSNAWGSAVVYGTSGWGYKDSAPNRAVQLHRNDGTKPDVILMYMGINDFRRGTSWPFGDLYNIIKNADPAEYNALVGDWFDSVLAATQNGTVFMKTENGVEKPVYTSFEQAYALAVYRMMEKYAEAEVLCIGLECNGDNNFFVDRQKQYNLVIKAIAEYFGAAFVDQYGEYSNIDINNMYFYGNDAVALHPNSAGHADMARMIMQTMAKIEDNDENQDDEEERPNIGGTNGSDASDGEYTKNY